MTVDHADAELLGETVRAAMRQLSSSEAVRRAMATTGGWEAPLWRRLSGELGLAGLATPATYGGAGAGFVELAYAFEETGASLLCAPFFGTAALALPLLLAAGDEDVLTTFAPDLVAGELTATAALLEDDGLWAPTGGAMTARRHDDQWLLDGTKNYVIDGTTAGLVLTVAITDDGPQIFAVVAQALGLQRQRLVSLDQTRKLARLVFDGTPARRLKCAAPAVAVHRAIAVARAMMAAEQAGGTRRCLDVTKEYVQTRYQFARPVGSFQMVKERLADMLIQTESARSAAYAAARALDDDADVLRTTLAARIVCNDAYTFVTAQMIQLHGGIGFTWEHDAHLYFKRARSSAQLLGDTHVCIEELAAELAAAANGSLR
ncbi:acyl-CoA dehydrogenase family protein [Mycobacterium sp. 94-17]|uniref:acyl-CoA dehydrogenase family protein n=1 Tax=Mycobacterium sp. 94-17 TaxID=2986147 RepID=UPI002D1F946B|nr:acyl-CoA dehydrogenase family protein [Mycobacterium sp. 94-17]MEB4209753.1 acyl-CoA/acyl-ACP dehydrogenase [Mycobacterium sp. 94-17]